MGGPTKAVADALLGRGVHSGGSAVVCCVWGTAAARRGADRGASGEAPVHPVDRVGDAHATCKRVAEKFIMANGITTTPDRQTVFVNDIGKRAVFVYSREVR
jgi:sugar lactone lactonase YvrE